MNFVLTRTMTYHFKSADMKTAKRELKAVDLIYNADCEDVLTCEDTGEEELL